MDCRFERLTWVYKVYLACLFFSPFLSLFLVSTCFLIYVFNVRGGFEEIEEAKHFKAGLVEDEIAYHEREHVAREAHSSTSDLSSSTRILGLFTSCGDFSVDTYMDAISLSSSLMN